MRFVDVIARKRDGYALTREEIEAFVRGALDGAVPDYQASALLMAIVLKGMSSEETTFLTQAMLASGERLDLSDISGVKVGKHSTGGVGDKVSIVLAPVAAACGVIVPKMSGRGLGHTGGTIDKLESIPGFRVDIGIPEFKSILRDVGTAIIGQSPALVPADKKLYALRDVTATVESIPLISASIMSKKLAEGASALVLDVKCGLGAFMKSPADAGALARALVAIGTHAGVRTEAIITSMNTPLGYAVGNGLEIAECIEVLRGQGAADVTALVVRIASRMVALGRGLDDDAERRVRQALDSGAALATLQRMIERQGGDPRVIDEPSRLPSATESLTLRADRSGYVFAMHAERIGRAAMMLGAGREQVDDHIDYGAGIRLARKPGDAVRAGDALLDLRCSDARRFAAAESLARSAISIDDAPPPAEELVLEIIR